MSEIKLSPPWYILRNQVAYTVGLSPNVEVRELEEIEGGYELPIAVKGCDKSRAIRAIMPPYYRFGDVMVIVNIYTDSDCGELIVPSKPIEYNTVEDLAAAWCTALHGNPLYIGLYLTEGKLPPIAMDILGQIVVVIDKKVVQFFNDDLSDLCQNYNGVAAQVFSLVCQKLFLPEFKVSFTTFDSDCINFDDLTCR